ncbi:replication-relaxation family protein (plasmid) [Rossellomorea sp. AcN35-11]|nr:replication-relaxation family protein [Rossellomorea aquimaris]WJV32257.1 replication-relaxation family protein [Rossellomorea sp. AcN35-11]
MADKLLNFSESEVKPTSTSTSVEVEVTKPPKATENPYESPNCPTDIFDFLPPDNTMFGMYSDPYARMHYIDPRRGNHNGRYWLNQRREEHSFTENEISLLKLLAYHRCATRNQIHRVVFNEEDRVEKVRDFLKKCRQRGIITAFSWKSPLNDGKKKPLVYGLTQVGADAAEVLFHDSVDKDFRFQPIEFTKIKGPLMHTFFIDLVANELFAELRKLDRVTSWERRPQIRLSDGTFHHPGANFEVIADKGKFHTFWLESIRINNGWDDLTINRFKRTQLAYSKLSDSQKPARVIVVLDSDGRIPYVAKLAEKYMPDLASIVRYTTDERLLAGLDKTTFIAWNSKEETMKAQAMKFLTPGHDGMTASEFFEGQELNIEEEFED